MNYIFIFLGVLFGFFLQDAIKMLSSRDQIRTDRLSPSVLSRIFLRFSKLNVA